MRIGLVRGYMTFRIGLLGGMLDMLRYAAR